MAFILVVGVAAVGRTPGERTEQVRRAAYAMWLTAPSPPLPCAHGCHTHSPPSPSAFSADMTLYCSTSTPFLRS